MKKRIVGVIALALALGAVYSCRQTTDSTVTPEVKPTEPVDPDPIVEFGLFPQTIMPASFTVDTENATVETFGKFQYYQPEGDSNWYYKLLVDNSAYNADGKSTYSDGSSVNSGSERWFKVEPIK
ncbi:MAG: hypothetical protein J6I73_00250 [Treponema sp.]|nr:hypothetical protein [Treponema sp.]